MTKYFNINVQKMINITYTYFPVAEQASTPQQQIYVMFSKDNYYYLRLYMLCFNLVKILSQNKVILSCMKTINTFKSEVWPKTNILYFLNNCSVTLISEHHFLMSKKQKLTCI